MNSIHPKLETLMITTRYPWEPIEIIELIKRDNIEEFKKIYNTAEQLPDSVNNSLTQYSAMFNKSPTVLCIAAYYNALQIADYLLQIGVLPDDADQFFRAPVHFAAMMDHVSFIIFLSSHGADINATDITNRLYIHWAAENNCVKVLQYAIMSGANIDAQAADGCPIHLACKTGSFRAIEILAKTGKVNLNRIVHDRSPLLHVMNSSCLEALPILFEYGMDINQNIVGNWTALHYVVRAGSPYVVGFLCKYGANPNIPLDKSYKWFPMHVAAQEHHSKIITILYYNGSLIHSLTHAKNSPFTLSKPYHKRDNQYGKASITIRNYVIDFFARSILLMFLTEQIPSNFEEMVTKSTKKYNMEMGVVKEAMVTYEMNKIPVNKPKKDV
ncbi:hypothetical protein TRFO_15653 [Tritrichomonas foetus]|uniref:Uncharacterized protein n=1 Tax=Tritrichomonas foetus TaxID=1144522 RepID=A0A1J4KSZ9_9EUKA|nr:hypothetical protein TRFO_15653 [Tritrichomonas foetus]|eukprot:OHT14008.1 hypothetical protein TRFO_15653 [Tritrichomonas foetus]